MIRIKNEEFVEKILLLSVSNKRFCSSVFPTKVSISARNLREFADFRGTFQPNFSLIYKNTQGLETDPENGMSEKECHCLQRICTFETTRQLKKHHGLRASWLSGRHLFLIDKGGLLVPFNNLCNYRRN